MTESGVSYRLRQRVGKETRALSIHLLVVNLHEPMEFRRRLVELLLGVVLHVESPFPQVEQSGLEVGSTLEKWSKNIILYV